MTANNLTKADQWESFLARAKDAATTYAAGLPVSVPRAEQQRVADRVLLQLRQMAASNPKVAECTPQSVVRCLALCMLSGMVPGGGPLSQVELIPRVSRRKGPDGSWSDGPMELQWQLGFRGYLALAERAGVKLKPVAVFSGDEFEWREGTEQVLRHIPQHEVEETWDTLTAAYVVFDVAGHRGFCVLRKSAVEKRRGESDGYRQWRQGRVKSTPWVDWPVEMALKTVIRYACSRGMVPLDDVARYLAAEDIAEERDVIEAQSVPATRAPAQVRDLRAHVLPPSMESDDSDSGNAAPDPAPPDPAPSRKPRGRRAEEHVLPLPTSDDGMV